MHGNQWVLKIAVLKYYSVSKRGTTAKSNPKQATDPISLHTKFGDNSSNTFPLNERKPCVTPDIGRRTAEKAKIICPPPRGGGHNSKIQNGTKKFRKLGQLLRRVTIWVKFFVEIVLSSTVSEIQSFWCFALKF